MAWLATEADKNCSLHCAVMSCLTMLEVDRQAVGRAVKAYVKRHDWYWYRFVNFFCMENGRTAGYTRVRVY